MISPPPVLPGRSPVRAQVAGVRERSGSNAEALWRAFAAARGHRVIDEPGWLVVDAGEETGGVRRSQATVVDGTVESVFIEEFGTITIVQDLAGSAANPLLQTSPRGTVNPMYQVSPGLLGVYIHFNRAETAAVADSDLLK